jgi:hypothetical protein
MTAQSRFLANGVVSRGKVILTIVVTVGDRQQSFTAAYDALIVELRNALDHGRMFGAGDMKVLRLLKLEPKSLD